MLTGTTFWTVITAGLAAGGFCLSEWRRVIRHHLIPRLTATILAVTALVLLGLRPAGRRTAPAAANLRAALWTPVTSPVSLPVPTDIDGSRRFALPGAARLDPAALPIPDTAFLRRHFPGIGTLRILGDGLDPSELAALHGLRVEFDPPAFNPHVPEITFLYCPRELNLGDPLILQGRLDGLAVHASAPLTLEAPDGSLVRASTTPADARGDAGFTLSAASPPSTGHFLWHLRVGATDPHAAADLPLGVAVIAPDLPRLLVLESAPRFDTGALRHWYQAAGGTFVARTQVGQDRYRFVSAAAAPPPAFTGLDAAFLAGFDLVLADTRELLALPPGQHDALLAAVADTGLGVLALPEDARPPAQTDPLVPWKLSPLGVDVPGSDRTARLQWPGQATPTDLPVSVAPLEIMADGGQRPLLGDRQGHTLAAARAHGRGQIAVTLVRDTTRWQRESDPAAFAAYWSRLFSLLARPVDGATGGRWSLREGNAGPVFVDHPMELLWAGRADRPPGPARVSSTPGTDPTTLALASDPAEPGRWRGTFWPRSPGWHQVSLVAGGATLDFFVSTADVWSALDAERRWTATAGFAEISAAQHRLPDSTSTRADFFPIWFAALFLGSVAYLWIERRLTV